VVDLHDAVVHTGVAGMRQTVRLDAGLDDIEGHADEPGHGSGQPSS